MRESICPATLAGYESGMTNGLTVALTIAGSDCSAGAGIQADLKTFQHFQVHGLTAVTCVVSETANIVRAVHAVPVELVRDQVELLMESFPVAAVKTGMLYSAAHVRAVAEILRNWPQVALVVDPVMVASTGASLLEDEAVSLYQDLLLPLARVITPNLPEAERLLGRSITADTLESAALELSQIYGTAVLLKGGHLQGAECVDVLADAGTIQRFCAARIAVAGSHGTGCTLSAAVTACLARGEGLARAVERAKDYLGQALRGSYSFKGADGQVVQALDQGTTLPKNGA